MIDFSCFTRQLSNKFIINSVTFQKLSKHKAGATIFLKEVNKPENYGVAKIKKKRLELG